MGPRLRERTHLCLIAGICSTHSYPEAGQSEVNGVEGHNHQTTASCWLLLPVPPSQDSYMSEERDGAVQNEQGMWIQNMPPVGRN